MKKIYLLVASVALTTGLFSSCNSDGPAKPVVGPPKVVITLNAPADGATLEVGTIDNIEFSWVPASIGTNDVTYEVVFDLEEGDFSAPLFAVPSDGTGLDSKATIPQSTLIEIAEAAGAEAGDAADLIWSVITTSGEDALLSEAKRNIAIQMPALNLAVVKLLKLPTEARQVDLKNATSLTFEWDAATWAGEGDVTYELVFDLENGTFATPLKAYTSSNNGANTNAVLTKENLTELAKLAGTNPDETTIKLTWKVRALAGGSKFLSDVSRGVKLIRESRWIAVADSCTYTLISQFMNKPKGTFNATSVSTVNYFYWQQAYPMHTVIYSYQRIKNTNPTLAAEYENYMALWYKNRANNYAGTSASPFYNKYTDDMAWIVLALFHMYDATGNTTYYNSAKDLYDKDMLASNRIIDDEKGWGLIWTLENVSGQRDRKSCTMGPAGIIGCRLYTYTGDTKYLGDAKKCYDYMKKNIVTVSGQAELPHPLSYTQGTWIEMCRLLYHITGEAKYMNDATTALVYTMVSGRCTSAYGGSHLLRDEGTSLDQSSFKACLIPYMVNYINDTSMPEATRAQTKEFLTFNAQSLWFTNMNKALYPKTFAGFAWTTVYSVSGNPGSLGAHNSGAALLEGMTRLN